MPSVSLTAWVNLVAGAHPADHSGRSPRRQNFVPARVSSSLPHPGSLHRPVPRSAQQSGESWPQSDEILQACIYRDLSCYHKFLCISILLACPCKFHWIEARVYLYERFLV